MPASSAATYERCLLRELELRRIPARQQEQVVIDYKGNLFTEKLRFDLLVNGCLLVELKAVQDVFPIRRAQITQLYETAQRAAVAKPPRSRKLFSARILRKAWLFGPPVPT